MNRTSACYCVTVYFPTVVSQLECRLTHHSNNNSTEKNWLVEHVLVSIASRPPNFGFQTLTKWVDLQSRKYSREFLAEYAVDISQLLLWLWEWQFSVAVLLCCCAPSCSLCARAQRVPVYAFLCEVDIKLDWYSCGCSIHISSPGVWAHKQPDRMTALSSFVRVLKAVFFYCVKIMAFICSWGTPATLLRAEMRNNCKSNLQ